MKQNVRCKCRNLVSSLGRATAAPEGGSMILQALVFAAIMGVMIGFSAIYVTDRIKQVRSTAAKMDYRVAADSVMAYTLNGIKQSWCFTTSWVQDISCDLNHPRNVERMLLSDEALTYIGATQVPHPTPVINTRLSLISQTVSLTSVTTTHPLYLILNPLKDKYSSVSFTIRRDDSAIQTTKGREVPLKVTIHMSATAASGLQDLELISKIYMYPREISYFSLVTPRDLYLGTSSSNAGDIVFDAADPGTSGGLRFESPVFVNDNLVLPTVGSSMSNVTFVDKVYMGGGMIRQGSKLFNPKSAGGAKSDYNDTLAEFGGILAGYELDNERDGGLDYLFNLQPPDNLDLAAFNLCKARITASVDLAVTKDAQLYTRLVSGAANTFNLSATIGRVDNLIEQNHEPASEGYTFKTDAPGVAKAGTMISRSGGSVFKVKIIYAGMANPTNAAAPRTTYTTQFYMTRSSEAVVYPIGDASPTNPQISVVTKPHVIGGNSQFNQVDFEVKFINAANLNIGPYSTGTSFSNGSVSMVLEALDYGYYKAQNIRSASATNAAMGAFKANGFRFFKDASNNVQVYAQSANQWYTNQRLQTDPLYPIYDQNQYPDDVDYIAFDEKCFAVPEAEDAYYMSFAAADWSTSYVKEARASWSFSPEFYSASTSNVSTTGYLDGELIIDAGFARFVPGLSYPQFKVQSLVKTCRITANANFVAGFYACENLIIDSRNTPLRIIGTFITANLKIDPTAYRSGIRWSSIYHPTATAELQAAQILGKDASGAVVNCNSTSLPPLWMPNIGIQTAYTHFICNPVSLRKADPFKWTTVDPDCAYDKDATKVKCKKRLTRFLVKEISRTGSL